MDMLTLNLSGGKQFKQGHYRFMEVYPHGSNILWKNVLSVLREWKKPFVKTSVFHDINI